MTTPVILDTCAIIYLFQKKQIICSEVIKKIENSAIILSISFAEIACKIKLNKLHFESLAMPDLVKIIENLDHMKLIDINTTMWLDAVNMEWPENRDPVDKLIVSYAKKRKLSIVTSDQKMSAFYEHCLL